MQVKISQAISMIVSYIKAGLVPMIVGSPGCGKSQIVHQIAHDHKLKVIDIRLAQCDPTDLSGFPRIDDRGRATYAPMDTFPLEGDPIPTDEDGKPYSGWLIFLDEMNSAPPAVQAAAYKLVLDRMIGQHKLHKNVAIVCAGNKETDNAIVQPMSTALQSRLTHLELVVDAKEWNEWASSNGVDYRITSYINWKPGKLYTFDPDHTDSTYAAPRTWEFASRLIKDKEVTDPLIVPLLAGTISEGVAREFIGFCKIFKDLPKLETINESPSTAPVPEDPGTLFALSGSLAHQLTTENIDTIIQYIERMPVEFQVVCLREAFRRNTKLVNSKAMSKWISNNTVLFK